MSAKTKIVVLRMKELIYTGIFAALGILFVVLLLMMFLPGKEDAGENTSPGENASPAEENVSPTDEAGEGAAPTSSGTVYIPGIYTTELVLGGQAVDVEVIVEEDAITSVRLVNLSESVTTMYPLLQPTFDTICEQIYETQSLEEISYTADSKYTSLVLLEAIQSSLDKASGVSMEEEVPLAEDAVSMEEEVPLIEDAISMQEEVPLTEDAISMQEEVPLEETVITVE